MSTQQKINPNRYDEMLLGKDLRSKMTCGTIDRSTQKRDSESMRYFQIFEGENGRNTIQYSGALREFNKI